MGANEVDTREWNDFHLEIQIQINVDTTMNENTNTNPHASTNTSQFKSSERELTRGGLECKRGGYVSGEVVRIIPTYK